MVSIEMNTKQVAPQCIQPYLAAGYPAALSLFVPVVPVCHAHRRTFSYQFAGTTVNSGAQVYLRAARAAGTMALFGFFWSFRMK